MEHKKLHEKLQKKYGTEITFKTLNNSNVFTVENFKKSKNCVLKRVGYVKLGSDFRFLKINEKSVGKVKTLFGLLELA